MSTTRVYSARLGPITDAQLQAALDRWGLGRLLGAEPVRWGNFGQVLFLSSTAGDFALRGAPHWPWQFREEKLLVDLLHERTQAPVPWPYLVDDDPTIFGWPYVLMPRLPGLAVEDPEVAAILSPDDRRNISWALGDTLAEMQELTWLLPGAYDPQIREVAPLGEDFGGWVAGRIRRSLEAARRHTPHYTTAADAAWVEDVLHGVGTALREPFVPRFTMQDYKYQNAGVERVQGGWRISGVFDIGGWFGDGEAALSRQVAMYLETDPTGDLARAFIGAYLSRRSARPGFGERFAAYMLDERLGIWEWAQREHMVWWDPRLSLREWVEPFATAAQRLQLV